MCYLNRTYRVLPTETDERVAIFTETCEDDVFSHARAILEPPITLSGTEFLAVFGGPGGVISVGAESGGPTEIREFHGKSGVACLPENAEVSLAKSPGGDLSTLLVVLGRGTIHQEHHRQPRWVGFSGSGRVAALDNPFLDG